MQLTYCASNLGSYCLVEERFLWFHHVTKLKKGKERQAMKIHHFIIQICELP